MLGEIGPNALCTRFASCALSTKGQADSEDGAIASSTDGAYPGNGTFARIHHSNAVTEARAKVVFFHPEGPLDCA